MLDLDIVFKVLNLAICVSIWPIVFSITSGMYIILVPAIIFITLYNALLD